MAAFGIREPQEETGEGVSRSAFSWSNVDDRVQRVPPLQEVMPELQPPSGTTPRGDRTRAKGPEQYGKGSQDRQIEQPTTGVGDVTPVTGGRATPPRPTMIPTHPWEAEQPPPVSEPGVPEPRGPSGAAPSVEPPPETRGEARGSPYPPGSRMDRLWRSQYGMPDEPPPGYHRVPYDREGGPDRSKPAQQSSAYDVLERTLNLQTANIAQANPVPAEGGTAPPPGAPPPSPVEGGGQRGITEPAETPRQTPTQPGGPPPLPGNQIQARPPSPGEYPTYTAPPRTPLIQAPAAPRGAVMVGIDPQTRAPIVQTPDGRTFMNGQQVGGPPQAPAPQAPAPQGQAPAATPTGGGGVVQFRGGQQRTGAVPDLDDQRREAEQIRWMHTSQNPPGQQPADFVRAILPRNVSPTTAYPTQAGLMSVTRQALRLATRDPEAGMRALGLVQDTMQKGLQHGVQRAIIAFEAGDTTMAQNLLMHTYNNFVAPITGYSANIDVNPNGTGSVHFIDQYTGKSAGTTKLTKEVLANIGAIATSPKAWVDFYVKQMENATTRRGQDISAASAKARLESEERRYLLTYVRDENYNIRIENQQRAAEAKAEYESQTKAWTARQDAPKKEQEAIKLFEENQQAAAKRYGIGYRDRTPDQQTKDDEDIKTAWDALDMPGKPKQGTQAANEQMAVAKQIMAYNTTTAAVAVRAAAELVNAPPSTPAEAEAQGKKKLNTHGLNEIMRGGGGEYFLLTPQGSAVPVGVPRSVAMSLRRPEAPPDVRENAPPGAPSAPGTTGGSQAGKLPTGTRTPEQLEKEVSQAEANKRAAATASEQTAQQRTQSSTAFGSVKPEDYEGSLKNLSRYAPAKFGSSAEAESRFSDALRIEADRLAKQYGITHPDIRARLEKELRRRFLNSSYRNP